MTREEYEGARAALLGNPPRHPKIGGEQVTSIAELDALADRMRRTSNAEPSEVSEPIAPSHAPDPSFVAPFALESDELRLLGDRIIAHIDQCFDALRTSLATAVNAAPVDSEKQSASAETVPPLSPSSPPVKPDATEDGRSDVPEIPENLGTLTLNQLKALAKARGVDPIPKTQAALLDAIEATRKGTG